ncbi:MAG: FecR domain-containing protein [Bacteroidota bacterium]
MKITPELLKKYDAGECSDEERLTIDRWLNSAEKEETTYAPALIQKLKGRIWSLLSEHLDDDKTRTIIPFYKRYRHYAAAAMVLFAIGFLAYNYSNVPIQNSEIVYFKDFKTMETQRGQKRTVRLSDGSTIRLNYETEIKIPERFEGDQRIVYLEGHAHFDIVRDPEKPFIIYTEDSKTRVLGTSFAINTKKEADETEIIVTSGKVTFSEKDKEENAVTLAINDRAILNADNAIYKNKVDAVSLTAWRDNILVFEDQTLREIIKVLEPWYDVTISIENPEYLNDSFTLSGENPPLDLFLKELSFAGNFEYRIRNKEVIIF